MHLSRSLCENCPHSQFYYPDMDSQGFRGPGYSVCEKNAYLSLKALEERQRNYEYDPLYFPFKIHEGSMKSEKQVIAGLKENCPYWLEHMMLNEDFTPLKQREFARIFTEALQKYPLPNPYGNFFKSLCTVNLEKVAKDNKDFSV